MAWIGRVSKAKQRKGSSKAKKLGGGDCLRIEPMGNGRTRQEAGGTLAELPAMQRRGHTIRCRPLSTGACHRSEGRGRGGEVQRRVTAPKTLGEGMSHSVDASDY